MSKQTLLTALKPLTVALICMGTSIAHANDSREVELLRQEVQQLRDLIQQQRQNQTQQQQQISQLQSTPALNASEKKGFQSNGAEVKFYGMIRADGSYQIEGGANNLPYNQISKVALDGDAGNSDVIRTTLGATRFGFDFTTPTAVGNVGGKLEADFLSGASYDNLRIRHAYLNYGAWLFGQTWSNFATPEYLPESIDALSYVGGSIKRTPQVRYNYKLNTNNQLFVALEDSKDSSIKTRLPALSARLNHKFANDQGTLGARAMVAEKRITADESIAWGVGLGTSYQLGKDTTLRADYYHVKGDSSFVSSTNPGFAVNAAGKIDGENEFNSIIVGLTQQFNPKLRGTLGYGYMKADKDRDYLSNLNKPNEINANMWQAWANMFYNPVKPVSLGVEYVYGERETFADATQASRTGEDNRVNLTAIYSF